MYRLLTDPLGVDTCAYVREQNAAHQQTAEAKAVVALLSEYNEGFVETL